MADYCRTISPSQWALFVWQRDECERAQGKACVGCGFMSDCIKLYQNVSNICSSDSRESYLEHENQRPSPGNPMCENHGEDIEAVYKRVHRNLRVVKKNGKVVA
jgi:hypothetical protein